MSHFSNFLWGGITQSCFGILLSIIDFIRSKNIYLQNLEDLRKDIKNKWNLTNDKCNIILVTILKRAVIFITMIYETQMSQINEKKLQEFYNEFIHTIGDNYIGEKLDGKKHGYGIYSWFDGSKYEGYYKNDLREGFGKIYWIKGEKYIGYWG